MKMSERIIWIFIVAFLIFILSKCSKYYPNLIQVKTQTISKIVYDTLNKNHTAYIPVHDTTRIIDSFETVYTPVKQEYIKIENDTVRISTKEYSDSIAFDSSGYIIIKDKIAGEILSRTFNYRLIIPKTIETVKQIEKEKPKVKFYLGAETTAPSFYVGGAIAMQLKNENIIKLGYGTQLGKGQVSVSFFSKIKLK